MNKIILITTLIFSFCIFGNGDKKDVVDFKNIREVLKNDGLMEIQKKKEHATKEQVKVQDDNSDKFSTFPKEREFWTFFSEYWLIKNAPLLKWDFRKPDYGVVQTFSILLESLGLYEKKIKILYLNSPAVTHYALPTNANEYIFLISLPFIRTMDLSKLEISLLLFEDFLRIDEKQFLENIDYSSLKKLFGTNFYGKKLDPKLLTNLVDKFDSQVYEKGFSFKQQFKITKKMDTLLKSDQKLWSTYYRLLKKIDELAKTNVMYQKHLKIYPSPELQLNWLTPPSKINNF